jgi:hypothetical protein
LLGVEATSTQQEEIEERIDQMQIVMRDPNEAEIYKRALTRRKSIRHRSCEYPHRLAFLSPHSPTVAPLPEQRARVIVMRDPNEAEIYKRALTRLRIDPKFASNMPPEPNLFLLGGSWSKTGLGDSAGTLRLEAGLA